MGPRPLSERSRQRRGLCSTIGNNGAHGGLAPLSRSYTPLGGRLPRCYSPVRHYPTKFPCGNSIESFDLHALDTPPAFTLSQDQTLKKESIKSILARGPCGNAEKLIQLSKNDVTTF